MRKTCCKNRGHISASSTPNRACSLRIQTSHSTMCTQRLRVSNWDARHHDTLELKLRFTPVDTDQKCGRRQVQIIYSQRVFSPWFVYEASPRLLSHCPLASFSSCRQ